MRIGCRNSVLLIALCAVLCLLLAAPSMALSQLPDVAMRIGAEGEHVQALQLNLIELNLYNGRATGNYDEATSDAVRALQTILDLPADGVCNEQTISAFNAAAIAGELRPVVEAAPLPLAGITIGIDPGHQQVADTVQEPSAPGAKTTKERMSEGGVGVKTAIPEYETTLLLANRIKKLLESGGATVVMTRNKHDVSISNAERAALMNTANVDCWIRIHCDSSSDRKKVGVSVLSPSGEYTKEIADDSLELAKAVLPAICKEAKAKQLSIVKKSDQTGFNYSTAPVITVEFGFLSNPTEDVLLNRASYQELCARGLYNGVLAYFAADTADTGTAE